MKLTDLELKAKDFYDMVWSSPNRIRQLGKELLSWHLGFYEKGINNSNEAKINMMDYVGRLLDLNDESFLKIFDACSSIFLTSSVSKGASPPFCIALIIKSLPFC